jgi:hypothetical protein
MVNSANEEKLDEGIADDEALNSIVEGDDQVEGEQADDMLDAEESIENETHVEEVAEELSTENEIDEHELSNAEIGQKLDALLAALLSNQENVEANEANEAEDADESDESHDAAAVEAARIAAESGVNAADVTGSGDAEAEKDEFANMTDDELWARYASMRSEHGQDAARAFYAEQIKNK